jgi:hypothetical protein
MTVNHYTTEEVQTIDNTGQVYRTSTRMSPAAVPDEHPQEAYHKKKDIFRSYQATWYIVGFIEFLLGFRVLLRLFGANPASGFANFIYSLSYPFAAPFINLFGTPGTGRFAFEPGTIIGMVVYFLVGFALERLLQMYKPTTPEEVDRVVSA